MLSPWMNQAISSRSSEYCSHQIDQNSAAEISSGCSSRHGVAGHLLGKSQSRPFARSPTASTKTSTSSSASSSVARLPSGQWNQAAGLAPLIGRNWAQSARSRSRQPTRARCKYEKAPPERGFPAKRLKGFEPSTFCMATTRASGVCRTGTSQFAGDLRKAQSALAASMHLDVRRYAAFREPLARSSRNRRGRFQSARRACRQC
jgi:hypothetical protein